MGTLEDIVVSREDEPFLQDPGRLRFVGVEEGEQHFRVGNFEIVVGEFHLSPVVDIPVPDLPHPVQVVDVVDLLDEHRDPFQPVGDLRRYGVHVDTADLLEIGELGYLHPVEPDLPAKPPRPDRR